MSSSMSNMPERAWAWSKRIHFGENRLVSLDWGTELWKWDVTLYESADGIRAALTRTGRPFDDDSILFDATSSLVDDVVDAAGGVEQAHQRLHLAVDAVHVSVAQWSIATPEGIGLSDPTIEAAWYTLEELLVWARTLDDRLRRKPRDKRYPDQGLIPALAENPRRDAIMGARSRLRQNGVQEARWLAGLNLHMQSTQAGSKHGRMRSGQVFMPFPDRVNESIGHRWQLTYKEDRDIVSFADGLMTAVERFMDDMIAAFEQNLPARFKVT